MKGHQWALIRHPRIEGTQGDDVPLVYWLQRWGEAEQLPVSSYIVSSCSRRVMLGSGLFWGTSLGTCKLKEGARSP